MNTSRLLALSKITLTVLLIQWISSLTNALTLTTIAAPLPNSFLLARYTPPKRGTPTKGVQGSGARGCEAKPNADVKALPLTLLVPKDHIGQTTSGHPTFFWYIASTQPTTLEFSLVTPGVAQPLLVQKMSVQKPGIVQLQLPPAKPELAVGKKYRWSVTLLCESADRYSARPYAQSWIERVAVSPEQAKQLTAAPSDRARAQVYAESGLWYDALAALVTARTANPSDRAIVEDLSALLNQVGLTQVAKQEQIK